MWKAQPLKIRLFGLFGPQSGLLRQKEDQFRSIFSKRSAFRPRSDKADLLGSTDLGVIFDDMPKLCRFRGRRKCVTSVALRLLTSRTTRRVSTCRLSIPSSVLLRPATTSSRVVANMTSTSTWEVPSAPGGITNRF